MHHFWIAIGRAVLYGPFFDAIEAVVDYEFQEDPRVNPKPSAANMTAMQALLADHCLYLTRDDTWSMHRVCSQTKKNAADPSTREMLTDLRNHAGTDLTSCWKDDATCAVVGLACIDERFANIVAAESRTGQLSQVLQAGSHNNVRLPRFNVEESCLSALQDFLAKSSVEAGLLQMSAMRWWMRNRPCRQGYTLAEENFIIALDNDEVGLTDPPLRDDVWDRIVAIRTQILSDH